MFTLWNVRHISSGSHYSLYKLYIKLHQLRKRAELFYFASYVYIEIENKSVGMRSMVFHKGETIPPVSYEQINL